MNDPVSGLLDTSTDSLETDKQIDLRAPGFAIDGLTELLARRNGFYAFERALHVFPSSDRTDVMTLQRWNDSKLWIREYNRAADGLLFFAEDVFCKQFALQVDGSIVSFDPETTIRTRIADDIRGWAAAVLNDHEWLTGRPLAHVWQEKHGRLPDGQRLCPVIPFILGGEYAVDNLYAGDAVERMRFLADLHLQIGHLAAGSRVKLEVKRSPPGLHLRRLAARFRGILRRRPSIVR